MPNFVQGQKLSFNGASPRMLDMTQLRTLKFAKNDMFNKPAGTMHPSQPWSSGTDRGGGGWGTWAAGGGGPGNWPSFNCLVGNQEIEAYPNQMALDDLGITDLYTLDADRNVVIQPRKLNAKERGAIQKMIGTLDAGNKVNGPALSRMSWLSGYLATDINGIKPPFYLSATIMLPKPYKQGQWAAVWGLPLPGGWPPEWDALEAVARVDLGFQLTCALHSDFVPTPNTNLTTKEVPWMFDAPGTFHEYGWAAYDDHAAIVYDGVIVKVFPTPKDWQGVASNLIINYAIAGEGNGWPGPLDPNTETLPPMKIKDVMARQMPVNYGNGALPNDGPTGGTGGTGTTGGTGGTGGGTGATGPGNGPSPAGTIITAAGPRLNMPTGDYYQITAARKIMANGSTVLGETGNVVAIATDGTAMWQHAAVGGQFDMWWRKPDGRAGTAWTQPGQSNAPSLIPPPPVLTPMQTAIAAVRADLKAVNVAAASAHFEALVALLPK